MDKRAQITEAAASCFLRQGFAETNLDEIVKESGVVRQTLYNYFENKDEIFVAALKHILASSPYGELDKSWYKLEPALFFQKAAKLQLRTLANPDTTNLLRLIVKECRRFPELQEAYAESIPKPFIELVAGFLGHRDTGKSLDIPPGSPGTQTHAGNSHLLFAWCFRAALTGYGTLANLERLINFELPNKSRYTVELSELFARLSDSDFIHKDSDNEIQASQSNQKDPEAKQVGDHESINSFLESQAKVLGRKRLAIVNAAIRVFSARGYTDASMDEISQLASVSKQTLYKYFPTKQALYKFVAGTIFSQLQYQRLPDTNSIDKYLRTLFQTLFSICRQPWIREFFRLVLGESKSFPLESGLLLIFVMDFGRTELESKLLQSMSMELDDKSSDHLSRARARAIALRSIMGSFILLNQIYIIGKMQYLSFEQVTFAVTKLLSHHSRSQD